MRTAKVQKSERIRAVWSGHSLFIDIYYSIQVILLADDEGPDQPARMRRLIWAFVVRK